jgi:hypothetical protein
LEGWAAEQGAREALDQAKLEQVQREHRNFLIFTAIGRELSAFAVKDEIVGAIPVLHHVQAFINFAPQLQRMQIATKKNGLHRFAEFGESFVGRML